MYECKEERCGCFVLGYVTKLQQFGRRYEKK